MFLRTTLIRRLSSRVRDPSSVFGVTVPSSTSLNTATLDDGSTLIVPLQASDIPLTNGNPKYNRDNNTNKPLKTLLASLPASTKAELISLRNADPSKHTVRALSRRFDIPPAAVSAVVRAPRGHAQAARDGSEAARAAKEARVVRNRKGQVRDIAERMRREINAPPAVMITPAMGVKSSWEIEGETAVFDRERQRRKRGVARATGVRYVDPVPLVIKTM